MKGIEYNKSDELHMHDDDDNTNELVAFLLVNKRAVVIKEQNTFSADSAMLGSKRSRHMACVTKRLDQWDGQATM